MRTGAGVVGEGEGLVVGKYKVVFIRLEYDEYGCWLFFWIALIAGQGKELD
jgi:hypothetical protein